MIRERTSAGLAAARGEGRIGGRRKKLDEAKRCEIAEAVVSGRKTAAQMARMFGVCRHRPCPASSPLMWLVRDPDAAREAAGGCLGSRAPVRQLARVVAPLLSQALTIVAS